MWALSYEIWNTTVLLEPHHQRPTPIATSAEHRTTADHWQDEDNSHPIYGEAYQSIIIIIY